MLGELRCSYMIANRVMASWGLSELARRGEDFVLGRILHHRDHVQKVALTNAAVDDIPACQVAGTRSECLAA